MQDDLARIEKLLGMILMHDMRDAPQSERAIMLKRAGFTTTEIGGMLGTTTAVISQQLYAARGGKKKTRAKKAIKKKKTRGPRVARRPRA